jgi:hypothetical protein
MLAAKKSSLVHVAKKKILCTQVAINYLEYTDRLFFYIWISILVCEMAPLELMLGS